MALSPEVVKSLKAELGRLDDQRKEIERTAAAIRHVLSSAADGSAPSTTPPVGGLGMRDAIRAVLRSSDRPLKPAQVADALVRGGFDHKGSVDLKVRVANDLWKMSQPGGDVRKKEGGYVVETQGGKAEEKR